MRSNLRKHFRDRHPLDLLEVGQDTVFGFPQCENCGLQVSRLPQYADRHRRSKHCRVGGERRRQHERAVASALALRREFNVEGRVLERVEVFKYLGRLLALGDDDAQCVRARLTAARKAWARIGKVLRAEGAPPKVAGKFFAAVCQAI